MTQKIYRGGRLIVTRSRRIWEHGLVSVRQDVESSFNDNTRLQAPGISWGSIGTVDAAKAAVFAKDVQTAVEIAKEWNEDTDKLGVEVLKVGAK